jgi:hypothetical protein
MPGPALGLAGLRRGRKPGSPNKVTKMARDAAARIVDDPAYLEALHKAAIAREIDPAIERMLWEYRFGKVKDHIVVEEHDPTANDDATVSELVEELEGLADMAKGMNLARQVIDDAKLPMPSDESGDVH